MDGEFDKKGQYWLKYGFLASHLKIYLLTKSQKCDIIEDIFTLEIIFYKPIPADCRNSKT